MAFTDFLQLQRAEVVADGTGAPRRILRLELGAGLTCSAVATTSTITATLQATAGGGGSTTTQVPVLAASVLVERGEGVVVAASTVHAAGDYTGSTTLQAVLASPTGDTVRARLWDVAGASYVSGAALTAAGTSPQLRTSGALTLASSASIYELHVDLDGQGDPADAGLCSFAALRMA
jgi:hypothetical protein